MKNLIFKIFVFFFLSAITSNAEIVKTIKIEGNKRISDETIKIFGDLITDRNYSSEDLNNSLKLLYESNFFEDISINLENSVLVVKLIESPIIENIDVNGVKNKKILEYIKDNISLKERMSFSKTVINNDKNKILNFLKSNGYYFATIQTYVDKNDELNSVNINFNVNLGDRARITEINFIGDNKFKRKKLLETIASEEHKIWKFISNKVYLNESLLSLDKRLLSNFYKNEGFYNVKISETFVEISKKKEFRLTYQINSGKKFFFGKSKLNLPDDYESQDFYNVYKILDKIEGQEYSLDSFNKILDQIEKITSNKFYDFIDAKVDKQILDDKIFFTFNILNSNRNYVEKINIFGNFNTLEEVIRNKFIVDEGDPLNNILFNKSINNLKSTGYFKNVKSEIKNGSEENLKIIDIVVEEQPTGEISLGAGFGTSGGTIGGGVSEKNFMGKGINLNTNLEISEDTIKGQFIYSKPNFAYTDNTLFTSLKATSSDFLKDYGYKMSENSFSIGTKFEQFQNLYFSPELDLSFEDLETNNSATASLKKQEGSYQDLYFNYGLNYDLRNSTFNPSEGSLTSFYQTIPMYSETKEISNIFSTTKYQKLSKNSNLIGKASLYLKTVNSLSGDDVRISKRATMPYNKLRGFEKGKVGPVDNNDFVGGNYVSAINLSTNLPSLLTTFDNVDISYFIDVGNVWGVDYSNDIDDSNFIRSSTGIGLDLLTPVGPLTFSFSQPITKKNTDKTESFRFNIGTTF